MANRQTVWETGVKTVVIFSVVFGTTNGAESTHFTLKLLDPSLDLVNQSHPYELPLNCVLDFYRISSFHLCHFLFCKERKSSAYVFVGMTVPPVFRQVCMTQSNLSHSTAKNAMQFEYLLFCVLRCHLIIPVPSFWLFLLLLRSTVLKKKSLNVLQALVTTILGFEVMGVDPFISVLEEWCSAVVSFMLLLSESQDMVTSSMWESLWDT